MSSPVAFKYFKQQQQTFKPPLIANENAFLGDVVSSEKVDPEHPISCGLYRLEKGQSESTLARDYARSASRMYWPVGQDTWAKSFTAPICATHPRVLPELLPQPFHPAAADLFVLSGTPLVYEYTYHEMKIVLEGHFDIADEAGNKVHATPGDVFHFPKGSKITFTTEDYGLAFYTGARKEGAA
ncbi:hypothetical protein LTR56_025717 [Elasticomyces elasticus]|nr:hypothetical protein LTR56_025717 [Elasticomyces elasticus]KAK3662007.1 hypothetical protein LTR22_007178 [Elasticomyces elasticus]KAK4933174.1 hypothetical protein LTR49_000658 [Elasticomyces elasticus]KAK5716001.1 hypothetical protein LTR15_009826 [Elasticomyces elasticus]KAK5755916.1 hypothetical protein LTS12_014033 [Elasticomyces elasticus]